MSKILFLNCSPNRKGNTYLIGEKILNQKEHEVLHLADYRISQYGQVFEDDQIREVLQKIESTEVLVIGTPVYWYTVSGLLKTFIDRLYLLPEAAALNGKRVYLFAQGSSPNVDTIHSITFLAQRLATLMGMELKGVVVDTSDGAKIINTLDLSRE